MGTSGAFKGSGGASAGDLRDSIADWLGDTPSDGEAPVNNPDTEPDAASDSTPLNPINPASIAPVITMWSGRSRGSSGGGSGGGAGDASGSGRTRNTGGGRSSGGVHRTVARVAGPAGRASTLAQAYTNGDRDALESAGLRYDELRALNDPLAVGQRIVEVAFETRADSSLEDSESRLIVAELVSWILESPDDQQPAPDDIVRHSIELMIAQSALVEVGDTIRQEKNQTKRLESEKEIRRAAKVLASQVTLNGIGTSSSEITTAIENSVSQLKDIYGATE